MIKEFLNTLLQVISLRSIVGYNGLVFALKKTPLIGSLIPDRLYATKELKFVYWFFRIIKEIFLLFIGKIAGLGAIYLITFLLKSEYMGLGLETEMSGAVLYADIALFLFLVYALGGVLVNRSVFRCSTEKEYLVFMLRMNARKLNNTLFIYDIIKLVIGYLIAGVIGLICGAPIWLCLFIPVLAVFIKLFGTGVQAFGYKLKRKRNKSLKNSYVAFLIRVIGVILLCPLVVIFVIGGMIIPFPIILAVVSVLMLLGVWGFFELKNLDPFIHRRALHDNIAREEIEKYREPDTTKNFKKISAAGTVKGDKKGFEYLNALFVRRHRSMLMLKPFIFTLIIAIIFGLTIYERIKNPAFMSATSTLGEFLRWAVQFHLLGLLVPISLADNSFKCTQAMYINCDNSLMTFSFFKQPEKIIKLFDIRIKQLLKINIGPGIACGLFADLILFFTGGQDYPLHYLVTLLIPMLITLIYSSSWLVLYYLFQPFTTTVKVKSGLYAVVRIIIGTILTIIIWVPAHSAVLAGILTVLSAAFLFFMRKLVFKLAPKTWRIKS
ncbi:MAG: hypothetical protein J6U54_23760 [Clostridiales bacterium]|nr:hypothetical protein [Clostridiales bacterium]